jgi:putative endonuclease
MTGVMREHRYFVYIVCSRSGTLYIGMTNSIYRRALQHKSGEIEGFASRYHCDRLVYYEGFDDVHRAIGREKQLKGWARAKKIALIESKNPVGRSGREVGSADGISRGSNYGPMRKLPDTLVPRLAGMGSLRLRSGQALRLRKCSASRGIYFAQDDRELKARAT